MAPGHLVSHFVVAPLPIRLWLWDPWVPDFCARTSPHLCMVATISAWLIVVMPVWQVPTPDPPPP